MTNFTCHQHSDCGGRAYCEQEQGVCACFTTFATTGLPACTTTTQTGVAIAITMDILIMLHVFLLGLHASLLYMQLRAAVLNKTDRGPCLWDEVRSRKTLFHTTSMLMCAWRIPSDVVSAQLSLGYGSIWTLNVDPWAPHKVYNVLYQGTIFAWSMTIAVVWVETAVRAKLYWPPRWLKSGRSHTCIIASMALVYMLTLLTALAFNLWILTGLFGLVLSTAVSCVYGRALRVLHRGPKASQVAAPASAIRPASLRRQRSSVPSVQRQDAYVTPQGSTLTGPSTGRSTEPAASEEGDEYERQLQEFIWGDGEDEADEDIDFDSVSRACHTNTNVVVPVQSDQHPSSKPARKGKALSAADKRVAAMAQVDALARRLTWAFGLAAVFCLAFASLATGPSAIVPVCNFALAAYNLCILWANLTSTYYMSRTFQWFCKACFA